MPEILMEELCFVPRCPSSLPFLHTQPSASVSIQGESGSQAWVHPGAKAREFQGKVVHRALQSWEAQANQIPHPGLQKVAEPHGPKSKHSRKVAREPDR